MPYDEKYYRDWYQKNKSGIAQKRKERYATDTTYRERALAASRAQQERQRHPRPKGLTTTLEQVSQKLGVSIWVLRAWRKKNFFPEPIEHAARRWFTDNQVLLLRRLKEVLDSISDGQHRTRQSNLSRRDEIVSWVYANWNA